MNEISMSGESISIKFGGSAPEINEGSIPALTKHILHPFKEVRGLLLAPAGLCFGSIILLSFFV